MGSKFLEEEVILGTVLKKKEFQRYLEREWQKIMDKRKEIHDEVDGFTFALDHISNQIKHKSEIEVEHLENYIVSLIEERIELGNLQFAADNLAMSIRNFVNAVDGFIRDYNNNITEGE